ncbi:MAG: hypothetical protein H7A45_20630 [Verrucomicrobiales bacterium]|nr:hypothetical protein [Verrucomicrobiales bacterium]
MKAPASAHERSGPDRFGAVTFLAASLLLGTLLIWCVWSAWGAWQAVSAFSEPAPTAKSHRLAGEPQAPGGHLEAPPWPGHHRDPLTPPQPPGFGRQPRAPRPSPT